MPDATLTELPLLAKGLALSSPDRDIVALEQRISLLERIFRAPLRGGAAGAGRYVRFSCNDAALVIRGGSEFQNDPEGGGYCWITPCPGTQIVFPLISGRFREGRLFVSREAAIPLETLVLLCDGRHCPHVAVPNGNDNGRATLVFRPPGPVGARMTLALIGTDQGRAGRMDENLDAMTAKLKFFGAEFIRDDANAGSAA